MKRALTPTASRPFLHVLRAHNTAPLLTSSNPLKDVFKLGWGSDSVSKPAPTPAAAAPKAAPFKRAAAPKAAAVKKVSAAQVSKGYVPDGMSAAQYAAMKNEAASKRANKVAFWAKKRTEKVETLDDWFFEVYDQKKKKAGAGHRFVKTKYDWTNF